MSLKTRVWGRHDEWNRFLIASVKKRPMNNLRKRVLGDGSHALLPEFNFERRYRENR